LTVARAGRGLLGERLVQKRSGAFGLGVTIEARNGRWQPGVFPHTTAGTRDIATFVKHHQKAL